MRGDVSEQSRLPVRSRARLSARPLARIMFVASSDNIISALTTTASLDSSPAVQTGRASMPCYIQISNEFVVSDNFPGPSRTSDNHSLSLLLNDTKKKLSERWE